MLKRFLASAAGTALVSALVAAYVRLVLATTRWTVSGAGHIEALLADPSSTLVVAFWHGRLGAMVGLWRGLGRGRPMAVLSSTHRDGRISKATMRRLGLDYPALQAINPRLIYCGCYGYSEDGPYAGRAAVDDAIQAASGFAHFQGYGLDGPRFANTVVADKVVGLHVSQAISMALYAREKTGRGQFVEVPMFECMVSFVMPEHFGGLSFEPALGDAGYARLLNPYRKPFKTSDGWVTVVPYNDHQWRRFFAFAGQPQMIDDPRYATVLARSNCFAELYKFIADTLAVRTTAECLAAFEAAQLPFAQVNTPSQLLEDPHLQAIGYWQHFEHPTEGRLCAPGIPVKFSDTPGSIRRHAPNLGEHTEEVLREFGLPQPGLPRRDV